jgi:hypothetical protein
MSFIKRLGNVVKGTVLTRDSDLSDLEHAARKAALEEELARITPSQASRDRLAALKARAPAEPDEADADDSFTDDQAAKLRALAARYEAGELDRKEYDRLRGEVLHGPGGMPQRTL